MRESQINPKKEIYNKLEIKKAKPEGIAVAFSRGVGSMFLLKAAKEKIRNKE